MSPPELLADGMMTVAAAVKFSGLSRTTLWRMMDRGDLPFVRGADVRARLIPKKAIIKWAQARLFAP